MAFMVGKVDFGNEQNFKTALETATPAQINSYMASNSLTADDLTTAYNTAYGQNISTQVANDYLSRSDGKIDWNAGTIPTNIGSVFSNAAKVTSGLNTALNTATSYGRESVINPTSGLPTVSPGYIDWDNSYLPADATTLFTDAAETNMDLDNALNTATDNGTKSIINSDGVPTIPPGYVPPGTVDDGTGGGTGGVTSNTPFGELITKLQDLIDTGKYDLSSIYDDYSTSLGNLSGDIDTYVTAAQDANNASMRTNMEGTAQSVLNELASRNMLNSSVASDTMSKSMTDLVQTTATNDMLAELQGAQFKMAIPELQAKALSVYSQTLASTLLPYELLMQALETDIYKYTPTL